MLKIQFITFSLSDYRAHVKAQETDRLELLSLKDSYEKKEIEWNKESSELRVQEIELREASVRHIKKPVDNQRCTLHSESYFILFLTGKNRTTKPRTEKQNECSTTRAGQQ